VQSDFTDYLKALLAMVFSNRGQKVVCACYQIISAALDLKSDLECIWGGAGLEGLVRSV